MTFLPSPRQFLWLIVIGIALGLLLTQFSGTKLKPERVPALSKAPFFLSFRAS